MIELPASTQTWVGRPAPRAEARLRLFCLPYAGGGSIAYRPWTELLPADIELCLVQLPGREMRMRETPYTSLAELASDLGAKLAPLLDRPYALFGHSMGALTAYALTRTLQEQGMAPPLHLFASGRRAPQIPEREAPIHQLADGAFIAALVHRYNGIPQTFLQHVDILRLFLPTLRADLTLIETYQYVEEARLDLPITAFGGWEDARATQVDLAAWRDLTSGQFKQRMFPGGHFFIQSGREALVEEIVRGLAEPSTQVWPPMVEAVPEAAGSAAWQNAPTSD